MNHYVVAVVGEDGYIYWIDNKLYSSKKLAFNRKKKLVEKGEYSVEELGVYQIERIIMAPVAVPNPARENKN